jgi:hypothetical protein
MAFQTFHLNGFPSISLEWLSKHSAWKISNTVLFFIKKKTRTHH